MASVPAKLYARLADIQPVSGKPCASSTCTVGRWSSTLWSCWHFRATLSASVALHHVPYAVGLSGCAFAYVRAHSVHPMRTRGAWRWDGGWGVESVVSMRVDYSMCDVGGKKPPQCVSYGGDDAGSLCVCAHKGSRRACNEHTQVLFHVIVDVGGGCACEDIHGGAVCVCRLCV